MLTINVPNWMVWLLFALGVLWAIDGCLSIYLRYLERRIIKLKECIHD